MIWFTADTHFGHAGIMTHQLKRAASFSSVEEMDEALIDGINTVVQKNDILYHLGDFAWRNSRYGHYRNRLRVRDLRIIRGNHDAASLRKHCSTFEYMGHLKRGNSDVTVHLCHYPLASWWSLHRGGYHFYGHCHGSFEDELNQMRPTRRAMDVGIDHVYKITGEWRPMHLNEALTFIELRGDGHE